MKRRVPFASGLPLTERERSACDAKERRALTHGLLKRKATPSKQAYSRVPTEADRKLTQRILGETDE